MVFIRTVPRWWFQFPSVRLEVQTSQDYVYFIANRVHFLLRSCYICIYIFYGTQDLSLIIYIGVESNQNISSLIEPPQRQNVAGKYLVSKN